MAFDTFDTDSVATAGNVFTNGNLTAQGGAGFALLSSGIAQTIEGKKSGKWYVEFTCNAVSGNVDIVGVVNSWGIGQFIGFTSGSAPSNVVGWGFATNGFVFKTNTTQTAVNTATWGATDVIGMAIDLDNGRIWWRKNTGGWIGTAGTPDPATNTNGFDISLLTTNNCRVYPACNLSGSAAKFTANFGATSFTGGVPSGFTSGWTNTTAGTYFGTFATSGRAGASGPVNTPPLNNKSVSKYTSTLTGSVTNFIIPFAGATASHLKGVIYDDTGTGGLPGALLGVSTNTIGSGAYGENTFTFTGVSVTNGTAYWFGVVSDTSPGSSTNVTFTSPQTGGIQQNSGTYASPTNPFGASPTAVAFRYPVIVNVATASTETGTAVMTFGGVSFVASGSHTETGSAVMAFSGVSFVSAGSHKETGTANMAFQGISFTAAGTVKHAGTGVMAFRGISIRANAINSGIPGSGLRQFWTF